MSAFKAYDIRGLYPGEVNEDLISRVGRLFSRITRKVVVGYDIRLGGDALAKAFIQSAVRAGCDVIDVGLVPNPVCFFHAFRNKCHAVYFTASHNPSEYNGMKILAPDGRTDVESLSFLKDNLDSEPETGAGSWAKDFSAETGYLKKLSEVKLKRKVRVAVDCMNGSSGLIIKNLLAYNGIEGVIINGVPKQDFGGVQPEPKHANVNELIETVSKGGFDFGIAFDGDCDRSLVISDSGSVVEGDVLGILFCKYLYTSSRPVCPVNTTMLVNDLGREVLWTPIGRPYIERILCDGKSDFGFEMSNHFYFNDFYPFSDGFLTLLKVAELVQGKKLSEMVGELPETFVVRENFHFSNDTERDGVYDKLEKEFRKEYSDVNLMDGVKVSLSNGWFLFRKSNTEPMIRFNSESRQEGFARELLEKFRTRLSQCSQGAG